VLFHNWSQSNAASLLWVSADPGCGKSVLAKYLADEVLLPSSTTTTTMCYFFFKEDFEDQKSAVTALCSILHQIFDQDPASFSTEVLQMLEDKGNKLLTSFIDLWDVLLSTAVTYKRGKDIVCILDGLDECEAPGRNQLIETISKFYLDPATRDLPIKFLLTSRPYLDIKAGFQELESKDPTIHLSGENEEEVKKISLEISLVVKNRIERMPRLVRAERAVLEEELAQIPNRTYLWVHLIFTKWRGRCFSLQRRYGPNFATSLGQWTRRTNASCPRVGTLRFRKSFCTSSLPLGGRLRCGRRRWPWLWALHADHHPRTC
jgi:hypothetical protein